MNFKYYNYDQDLFEEIIGPKAEIYIFKNYQDLEAALSFYQPPALSQQSLFLTQAEFLERLLSSDQIVIKEEKLPLLLYSVLTAREKAELNLGSYQDIYQFSAQFFAYFNLLQDQQLPEIEGLTGWQEERQTRLQQIKKRYQKRLAELGYSDYLTLKEQNNLNLAFLNDYQKINFFNILEFSPYLADILRNLSRDFKVELHLQLQKGDFDQENLRLEQITFPTEEKINIEIRKSSSKLKSLAGLLDELENSQKEAEIMVTGSELEEAEILNTQFKVSNYYSYQKTSLYIFLEGLYQLYQAGKKDDKILIELKTFLEMRTQKLFCQWLQLEARDFKVLENLISRDYYYLDRKIIETELPKLEKLLDFLKKIRQIKNIDDLITVLTEKIDLNKAAEKKEEAEKFNDSLLELKAVRELKIVTNWQDYYSDQAAGLFALFLNHLGYKKIRRDKAESEQNESFKKLKLNSIKNSAQRKRKKLLLKNSLQQDFALKQNGLYFLSEKQLQENRLGLKAKKQILKRYNFLRHLFNAEKVVIFTVENEAQNIFPAVILEELALEYQLEIEESKLENISEKEILNNLFDFQQKSEIKVQDQAQFAADLKLELSDFNNSFNFGYYKYKHLKDCSHRFYLEELAKLETSFEFKEVLSLMTLGIMTHQIFGELINYARSQNLNPAKIPAQIRKKIIKRALAENQLKINQDYLNYYRQIICRSLEKSYLHFAELLQKHLPENLEQILVEWPAYNYQLKKYFTKAGIDFYLSGRIDLLLLRAADYFIIDFKTGSGDQKQLDFYSLMLRQNYQSQLPDQSRKAIYNIFTEELEHAYNKEEKEDKLGSELIELTSNLFAVGSYERIYKSRCLKCPYLEVCRVEVKNDEKSY